MSLKSKLDKSLNEKDVENVYRTEFIKLENSTITSPHGVDGLLKAKNVRTLLEFKYDNSLKNKLSQSNILIQCLYYLKKFENVGQKLPTTIFVGDINECFAIHTNSILKYLSSEIDWKIAPSEAHKKNPTLIKAMVNDENILPFVYDVNDQFNIKTIIDKIKDFSQNLVLKVRITKNNLVSIFNYFDENILKNVDLTTNEKANLFIQLVINPNDNCLHPKRKNVLITKSFGEINVNQNLFKSFFKHFEGDIYSPKEKEELTSLVDRLVEDTTRRKKGEFFTPTPFVNLAHQYISDTFGSDWKEKYVVWDCAWGTGNLTRDYKFKELYVSSLEQSDIDTANQMGYNPEANKFQFDFLNDPDFKLPEGLLDAITCGKEILFLINPPYATAANFGESDKKDSGKTKINIDMLKDNWGSCSQNLYAQFLYRISKYNEKYKNIKIGIFCPPLFLTGKSFDKMRKEFGLNFKFKNGFVFKASHFSDVKNDWGISFTIFNNEEETNNDFNLDIVDYSDDFSLIKVDEKIFYNTDNTTSASEWVRQEIKGIKTEKTISLKNSLVVYNGTDNRGSFIKNSLGYLVIGSNNIDKNSQQVSLWSNPFYNGHGLSIIPENFEKCTSLFTARKIINKNWINSKDEYLEPNTKHSEYEQFKNDSIVVSLFQNCAYQSSLRQVSYKDKLWDIKNEFFWMSKGDILNLANDNNYDEVYKDAKTSDERFVYKKLFQDGIYEKLSPDAKEVLDIATELTKKSFEMRKLISENNPEYHLDSWDAGYAQLKLVWKEYFKDEFNLFREKYKSLEDRLRPLVYEIGFLKH